MVQAFLHTIVRKRWLNNPQPPGVDALVIFAIDLSLNHQHFNYDRIAYKYLTWLWQRSKENRGGLTHQPFAQYFMMKLGIGRELEKTALNPKHLRKLASEEELLALRPELIQTE